MRILIVSDDGELIGGEAEIVVLLRDPATLPAISVFPEGADIRAWNERHDQLLVERERQAGIRRIE